MGLRGLAVLLMAGYFVFSVIYIYRVGFAQPEHAIRIGLAGLVVMAVAMLLRRLGRRGE